LICIFYIFFINLYYFSWKQGEALGSKSEGIIAPIEAIIRKKGRGLGS
jgi:hypothetical protein